MSLPTLILFIAITLVGIDLVIILLYYRKQASHITKLEKERDLLLINSKSNPEVILDDARRQASALLKHAQEKAERILTDTKQFQLDAKRILEAELKDVQSTESQELQKATNLLMKNFEESLAKIEKEDVNLFKNISEAVQKDVTENMKEFKLSLQKETVATKKDIEDKIKEQYVTVNKEIEEYKTQEIAKVQAHIIELIHLTITLALHKSLTVENHQELVLEALEEAKKEIG